MEPPHCQRCRLPLVSHDSLIGLSPAQIGLLTSKKEGLSNWRDKKTVFGGYVVDSSDGRNNNDSNSGDSFVMLTDSLTVATTTRIMENDGFNEDNGNGNDSLQGITPSALSQLNKLERLYEVLSCKGDIDYPICSECADLIKEKLKPKYEETCKERDKYISFLNKIKDQPGNGSEEVEEMIKGIAQLEKDNEKALTELKKMEAEREQVENELKMLEREATELQKEESQYYQEQNKFILDMVGHMNEKNRVESLLEYKTKQLDRLHKVNVYNDVFCIGHDGHFGTINGLRLGRLREKKVEWSEINAAWGQTVLLLATVIQKLNFKLIGYRLRPMGSMSKIDKFDIDHQTGQIMKTVSLELYSSGDYSFERILSHKRLDYAMVAFLTVLKQVGELVEKSDASLKLPYVIDKDKIGGCSIRLSLSASNDSWTTACKYVLTNCKWILAYASIH